MSPTFIVHVVLADAIRDFDVMRDFDEGLLAVLLEQSIARTGSARRLPPLTLLSHNVLGLSLLQSLNDTFRLRTLMFFFLVHVLRT